VDELQKSAKFLDCDCYCRRFVADCFAGTTLLLVLPEAEHDLDGEAVQRHWLLAASDLGYEELPEPDTRLLQQLPSVVAACEQGCTLLQTGIQPHNAE
jgi:hypothetical protein